MTPARTPTHRAGNFGRVVVPMGKVSKEVGANQTAHGEHEGRRMVVVSLRLIVVLALSSVLAGISATAFIQFTNIEHQTFIDQFEGAVQLVCAIPRMS